MIVNIYHKILTRTVRFLQWLLGAATVGVRTLVINEKGQILLVKHTYMLGWHFPGGGVFPGEPVREAAIRELHEETGVIATGEIELYGVYFHQVMRVNDYIVFYLVKQFTALPAPMSGEIAEVSWFDLENLPTDISNGTRARVAEYFYRQPKKDYW